MPFAPHEIENKRFVVALRGYQTDEVDAFLRAVAADYRAALEAGADDAELREKIERLEQAVIASRDQGEREAAELREATMAELQAERAKAKAEIAELRAAADREVEAAYVEIARQADELRRLEAALWNRVHVLEHAVVEARQTLAHVSRLEPMAPRYRAEVSLAAETNAALATADL
jgi:DivIVA domain-containing protein